MQRVTETTTLLSGYTVLCMAGDGSIDEPRHGLFHRDTAILTRYRLTLGGEAPELVGASAPELDRWEAMLRIRRPGGQADGPLLPQDSVEVQVRRRIGPALHEELLV